LTYLTAGLLLDQTSLKFVEPELVSNPQDIVRRNQLPSFNQTIGTESGPFINLVNPANGYLLKFVGSSPGPLGPNPGAFIEATTFHLASFIGFGQCSFGGGDPSTS
jgi:hypothetical protein